MLHRQVLAAPDRVAQLPDGLGAERQRRHPEVLGSGSRARGSAHSTSAQEGAAKEDDTLEQLKKLGELRDSGVLTDEEFEAQKKELLGS